MAAVPSVAVITSDAAVTPAAAVTSAAAAATPAAGARGFAQSASAAAADPCLKRRSVGESLREPLRPLMLSGVRLVLWLPFLSALRLLLLLLHSLK